MKEYTPESDSLIRTKYGKRILHYYGKVPQLFICFSAHCGPGVHPGIYSTVTAMTNSIYWKIISSDVRDFVLLCLVCFLSAYVNKVPRPPVSQKNVSKLCELLYFDYLSVNPNNGNTEYILVLKVDFSGCIYLNLCENADSRTASNALHEYFSNFPPVLNGFSD